MGVSKIDMVKEFALGLGLNPEDIVVTQAFSAPERPRTPTHKKENEQIFAP